MRSISLLLMATRAACGRDNVAPTSPCCAAGQPAIRIVNAFSSPVDVLIDGDVIIASLPAGIIDTAPSTIGDHMLVLRQSGSSVSMSQSITETAHALSTIAVIRGSNGAVASARRHH